MIVTTPTDQWVRSALSSCRSSLHISSPYIGAYLQNRLDDLPADVTVTILTRTLIADFASNASDFDTVCELARRYGGVKSLSSLHAKVYVVDSKIALVTSANATHSGMLRNHECGIQVSRKAHVQTLARSIANGFGSKSPPKTWTLEDLMSLRAPVETLRTILPSKRLLKSNQIDRPEHICLPRKQMNALTESFAGWLKLTIEGITQIASDTFSMKDVWVVCEPLARRRFPNNRHVREKLRQQLQRLRDIGFIQFLGAGRYERLASAV